MLRPILSRLFSAAVALLAASPLAAADPVPVEFLGETYTAAYSDAAPSGNGLVELVRSGEKVESWSKLVAVHRFSSNTDSPKQAVKTLAAVLKRRDPTAAYGMIENPRTHEAMIDFLASEAGSDTIEFNVFKYARHPSGKGLVAFQFAQRFKVGEVTPEDFSRVRRAAVDATAHLDMGSIIPYQPN